MSSSSSRKKSSVADLLADIQQHILQNQAGKTASNKFTTTTIIPLDDEIQVTDSVVVSDLPLWFEITNAAGGGTTSAAHAGKIGQSVITEHPTLYGQICDDNGEGSGVMVPGVISTTVTIDPMSSYGA